LDAKKIEKCMGDPNADTENIVLKQDKNAPVSLVLLHLLLPIFYLRVVNIEAIIYSIFVKICCHGVHVANIYDVVMLEM
jgi:hypothetical protein